MLFVLGVIQLEPRAAVSGRVAPGNAGSIDPDPDEHSVDGVATTPDVGSKEDDARLVVA